MMYTVEQIMQAIGTLGKSEKKRLMHALSKAGQAADAGEQLGFLSAEVSGDDAPDYVLAFDASSTDNDGLGCGGYAISRREDNRPHIQQLAFGEDTPRSEAEYEALILGLESLMSEMATRGETREGHSLHIYGNSRPVIQQMQGLWKVKDARIRERRDKALELLSGFASYRFGEVPRSRLDAIFGTKEPSLRSRSSRNSSGGVTDGIQ